ncbi:metallophosphatase domain-containing protein [Salegentibacter sediminis]|uniref:metallophosphatase domain-containing protein n=1 Tax=Salegentibacter sediminis TaxID=1930251 RepID=UPI0009BCE7CF|nr:metallophosphatase domain-containing protein [Salegentibacter sediminis]
MKLVCIGDTHNKHREIKIPDGDVLIHVGDFTEAGTKHETLEFLEWFIEQPHKYKIVIAGNHDFFMEKSGLTELYDLPSNIFYLEDEGIEIEGVKFWGSPVTPGDGTWAFNRERGKHIRSHWNRIPADTQVLITHTPPYSIKDSLSNKRHVGCEELFKRIKQLQLPLHIFGHIHNTYGKTRISPTTYINASSLDDQYRFHHSPIIFEL